MNRARFLLVAVATIIAFTVILMSLPIMLAIAQQRSFNACRFFRETNRILCDPFLSFWQKRGDVAIFGYPISNILIEKSDLDSKDYVVQYFERAVFEFHPENNPPYDVLLAQLGTLRFNSSDSAAEKPDSYMDRLPLYPDAYNVQIVHPQNSTTKNRTTFASDQPSNVVLNFYKDTLQKAQWTLFKEEKTSLIFYYPSKADEADYRFSVYTDEAETGGTTVQLLLDVFNIP